MIDPLFGIFRSLWVPILWPIWSYWLFLQKKISLSLSHLVQEIVGSKIGLICHKNLWFDSFEAFCTNFLITCQSSLLPFSFKKIIFLTPHFYKMLDPIVSIFSSCAGPSPPGNLVKCPSSLLWITVTVLVILVADDYDQTTPYISRDYNYCNGSKGTMSCSPIICGKMAQFHLLALMLFMKLPIE